ncbi:MAG: LuxR C-terminal-related transcriptional regulator, partial [Pseudomonadota bacterium]
VLIRRLQEHGVYLEHVGGDTEWYRLLPLFKDVLEREAAERFDDDAIAELHKKAAEWHEQTGLTETAIQHAIASNNRSLMVRLITEAAPGYLKDGRLATLANWYQALPTNIRETSPELLCAAFWAFLYTFRLDEAKYTREAAQAYAEDIGETTLTIMSGMLNTFSANHEAFSQEAAAMTESVKKAEGVPRHTGNVGLAYYHIQKRDFESARRHILESQVNDVDTDRLWSHPNPQLFSATITALKGNVSAALSALIELADAERRDVAAYPVRSASLLATYGAFLAETGALDDAETILSDSLSMILSWSPPDWVALPHLALHDIKSQKNQPAAAAKILDSLEVYARKINDNRILASIAAKRSVDAMLNGYIDTGIQILEAAHGSGLSDRVADMQLISSELLDLDIASVYRFFYERKYHSALRSLQAAISSASREQRGWRLIKLHTLKAVIQYERGDHRFAKRALTLALKRAHGTGFAHTFIGTHPLVRDILTDIDASFSQHQLTDPDAVHQSVRHLLSLYGDDALLSKMPDEEDTTVDTLTPRELELLSMVAQGLSNGAIADHASVSQNTVKWHLSRAYQKLGVRQRTHAVVRARAAGLLT